MTRNSQRKTEAAAAPPARAAVRKRGAVKAPARASEADAGEEKAAYLLRQVAERLGISLIHALRPFKQTPSVYRVLIALTRRSPVRMRDLIELTLIEPSVLSRTVAAMKRQGLVEVTPDEEDGRSVVISSTDGGLALLQAMLPAVTAQYDWAVHDIPPANLEVMRSTLQQMLHNLKISPIK